MRHRLVRTIFTLIATLALVGAVGASALAHGGDGPGRGPDDDRGEHRHGGDEQGRHGDMRKLRFNTGTTTLTIAQSMLGALSAAGVAIEPVAPGAAVAGVTGAYTFPVTRARLRLRGRLEGDIRHAGGLKLTKGTTTGTVSDFRIDLKKNQRSTLKGKINGTEDRMRLLLLTNVVLAVVDGKQTLTADAMLARPAARLLNRSFGTTMVAGAPAGTIKVVLG